METTTEQNRIRIEEGLEEKLRLKRQREKVMKI